MKACAYVEYNNKYYLDYIQMKYKTNSEICIKSYKIFIKAFRRVFEQFIFNTFIHDFKFISNFIDIIYCIHKEYMNMLNIQIFS